MFWAVGCYMALAYALFFFKQGSEGLGQLPLKRLESTKSYSSLMCQVLQKKTCSASYIYIIFYGNSTNSRALIS